MLIVLFVIAVLILLFVPNLVKQTDNINNQGNQALTKVIETQSEMYFIDNNKRPRSTDDLLEGGYISEDQKTKADELEIAVK
ncbi:competence protein ComG [Vagococcus fluvialis]|uniref:Competence protein ComG n=2 Tax=Vagococcus fluvialis TaxID=2738 RepID=A0A7X6D6C2_9ENTE|nr:competence protein ComG [Vagococcus fluvialis]